MDETRDETRARTSAPPPGDSPPGGPFSAPARRALGRAARALAVAVLAGAPAAAQVDCLECHAGAEGSAEAAHFGMDCALCHVELEGLEELPHPLGLARVDCTACHDDDDGPIAAFRASRHGRLAQAGDAAAPVCQDCHGSHAVRPPAELSDAGLLAPTMCAGCHGEHVRRMEPSPHLAAGVGCQDCHGGHAMTGFHEADLALATGRVNALCAGCHTDVLRAGPGELHGAVFGKRSCLACHDPHDGAGMDEAPADRACLLCHAADQAGEAGQAPPAAVAGSVHGAAGVSCVLCHADLEDAELPHEDELEAVRCAACHPGAGAAWAEGVHARGLEGGGSGAPAASCADCHGTHDVRAAGDPLARVAPRRQPATCERCHRPDPPAGHPAPAGEEVRRYETSIHGRLLLEQGLVVTATCSSCHGSHEIRASGDPGAATSRSHVPTTCGTCHAGMLEGYLAGVHGAGFLSGAVDVPVCTDCHTEHGIEDPALESSTVSSALVGATCARCHGDDALASLYGFESDRLRSWGSSYHGIATALGERSAANCASCHGHHEILPSSDPRSRVHPDNLDETCGSCHEEAGAAFARVPVHSVVDRASNPVAWAVRTVYAWLIGVVIGGFLLFILIDLFGRLRLRLGLGPPETDPLAALGVADAEGLVAPGETFPRMSLQGRLQHGILILSFSLLVLTGLPLFLHDLPWMRSLIDLEGGFRLRSRLHRAAALGLIGLSLWHLGLLLVSPGARRWFRSILLGPRDVADFLREALFHLGLAKERPALGRYGLVEKLEYGAVLWGNLVMIATGTVLWRPEWFLDWAPSWTFDVCRVVHGFEATLAFLAIVVWHMYHVHLRPGSFPMSRVWLTGRITARELEHHHPLEYAAILERRRAARRRAEHR